MRPYRWPDAQNLRPWRTTCSRGPGSSQLILQVAACDPAPTARVEESATEVRVTVDADVGKGDCSNQVSITLDRPLGDPQVIDDETGAEVVRVVVRDSSGTGKRNWRAEGGVPGSGFDHGHRLRERRRLGRLHVSAWTSSRTNQTDPAAHIDDVSLVDAHGLVLDEVFLASAGRALVGASSQFPPPPEVTRATDRDERGPAVGPDVAPGSINNLVLRLRATHPGAPSELGGVRVDYTAGDERLFGLTPTGPQVKPIC